MPDNFKTELNREQLRTALDAMAHELAATYAKSLETNIKRIVRREMQALMQERDD
jgi:hypothetical protein